uniref:GEO07746p1 n=1 Tax=Drosophila melanogaster TaxID=7227 RepID=Q9VMH8_DROME|eukprot:NP_001285661.1 prefoldin 1, isoform B [Drosophila melanogaster]
MAQMDIELKKAFTEMQINKLETTKKIHMIDMKCDMVKTGKQKYQLTEKGTSSLADDTRVYQSVGRMFLLTDVQNMREDLKARQEKCDKAIELLEKKKEFLQKSLKSQEDGLRELVQQRKEADQTAK